MKATDVRFFFNLNVLPFPSLRANRKQANRSVNPSRFRLTGVQTFTSISIINLVYGHDQHSIMKITCDILKNSVSSLGSVFYLRSALCLLPPENNGP